MLFKDKVVIVTDATSELGRAICVAFSKEGALVVIVGQKEDRLLEIQKECNEGPPLFIIKANIAEEDETELVINETITKYNKIDVLINNAMVFKPGCMFDGSILETYDDVMDTNVRAAVYLTSLATPHLVKSKGNIVNVSSIGGERVLAAHFTSYCISHAALNHFTKAAAIELGKEGVRVNSVSPGVAIDGEEDHNTLLPNWVDSSEIADLIIYLASDDAKSVTGSNFVCDSGGLATQKTVIHNY